MKTWDTKLHSNTTPVTKTTDMLTFDKCYIPLWQHVHMLQSEKAQPNTETLRGDNNGNSAVGFIPLVCASCSFWFVSVQVCFRVQIKFIVGVRYRWVFPAPRCAHHSLVHQNEAEKTTQRGDLCFIGNVVKQCFSVCIHVPAGWMEMTAKTIWDLRYTSSKTLVHVRMVKTTKINMSLLVKLVFVKHLVLEYVAQCLSSNSISDSTSLFLSELRKNNYKGINKHV